jgi:hypothetical protein
MIALEQVFNEIGPVLFMASAIIFGLLISVTLLAVVNRSLSL